MFRVLPILAAALALLSAKEAHTFPQSIHSLKVSETGGNACLQCHGNKAVIQLPSGNRTPPILDASFSMNWLMYEFESTKAPPFQTIPTHHSVSRGRTCYDWPTKRMTEIYSDRCIDIFPSGNNFSCQFLSDHDKTYFIRYELGDLKRPQSCCLWSKEPFWAPRPDVIQTMKFQQDLEVAGNPTDFWVYDIPLPGPFGYGTAKNSSRPIAFWFPVIGGWVQQNFSSYTPDKPDPIVFNIPEICVPPAEGTPLETCKFE